MGVVAGSTTCLGDELDGWKEIEDDMLQWLGFGWKFCRLGWMGICGDAILRWRR